MKKILMGLIFGLVASFTWAQESAPVTESAPDAFTATVANNNFQVERYLGTWYEIARLPMHYERNCLSPITLTYEKDSKGLKITNRCRQDDGGTSVAAGQLTFNQESNVAKMVMSFSPSWLKWTSVGVYDYWILYTDYDNFALVGSPDKKYLWVLARKENNTREQVQKLINMARDLGYSTQNLILNTQAFNLQ